MSVFCDIELTTHDGLDFRGALFIGWIGWMVIGLGEGVKSVAWCQGIVPQGNANFAFYYGTRRAFYPHTLTLFRVDFS